MSRSVSEIQAEALEQLRSMSADERQSFIRSLQRADVAASKDSRRWVRPRLGSWLQHRRHAVGLNQDDVARAVRLSRTAYLNYEAGKQGCSVEMFLSLCDVFSVDPVKSLAEVLYGDGGKP